MKKQMLILSLLCSSFIFSQSFEKVQLNNFNIYEYSKMKYSLFDGPSQSLLDEFDSLQNEMYIFELYHNDIFLTRQSLVKWNPFGNNGNIRPMVSLALPFEKLPAEFVVKLMQHEWKVKEIGDRKYVYNNYFDLVEDKDLFDIKYYKLIEK